MTKSYSLVADAIKANGDALFSCYVKVPRHVVKKNGRPTRRIHQRNKFGLLKSRSFPGKSPELVQAESHLIHAFRAAMLRHKDFNMLTGPMWCVFLFYFPADQFFVKNGARRGKLSGRLPDLSNLYELPQDCLQKAGVIENDHLICSHDLSRRLPGQTYALELFIFSHPLDVSRGPDLQVVK